MRGLPKVTGKGYKDIGITPALAGTTQVFLRVRKKVRDHPRACGDYFSVQFVIYTFMGSPPRLRGLLFCAICYIYFYGITPALAGTTEQVEGLFIQDQDHPRACGDYCVDTSVIVLALGSPPRLRGLLGLTFRRLTFIRITPALAGTT